MSAFEIPAATRARQKTAADPERSAWVSANAGSGKTFVLARRVIRLLLAGTAPERILCLTFTKAAAAEMQTRVFETLGTWTGYDDERLSAEVEEIEGKTPDAAQLARARHLFASALETPGGLKIQTIHAFCEGLLHQFPLEANVAGHFTVLDDRQASELLASARSEVLVKAEADPTSAFGRALIFLIAEMPDSKVEAVLAELVSNRDALSRWLADTGSVEKAICELRASFGLAEDETLAQLDASLLHNAIIQQADIGPIADALDTGSKTDGTRANFLRAAYEAMAQGDGEGAREAWLRAFLNKDRSPAKSLATKAIKEGYPLLVECLYQEQERLLGLLEKRKAAYALAGTAAALSLADGMLQAYERGKTRRGLMDFEDLIVRTAALLSRADAALWVQYKLDQGLDHILVDEAQDTSPHQWQVIRALAEEFFAGVSANPRTRTLFAVGDEKQSIYSFQGAVPAYFAQMRAYFERRAKESESAFSRVELTLSFRSRPDVLSAVDTVFADPLVRKGLSQDAAAPVHEAIRRSEPGYVEIWPPEEPADLNIPDDWTAPIDSLSSDSPMIRLAGKIAQNVKIWEECGEAAPGDVLILVRKRGPFVDALTRALKVAEIPVAGSDRLILNDHIAVQDLIALGRFLLLPEDSLSLAAVLKSPLFGLDDEALFELVRPDGVRLWPGTLWQSLVKAADGSERWAQIRYGLEEWRGRADFMPPYEFYARLLGADGGRKQFRGRLGSEVDDVLDEFLALTLTFEQTGTPGLEGFLAWFAAAQTQVKRELNAARGVVRIMTVHGAKGLEAPLVILADGGNAPVVSQHDPAFLKRDRRTEGSQSPSAFVWLPPKLERSTWHTDALEHLRGAAEEEYRRLLYVAMTRARDRLVVCGWAPRRGQSEACWQALITNGLDPSARDGQTASGDACRIWQAGGKVTGAPILNRTASRTDGAEARASDAGSDGGELWLSEVVQAPDRPRRLQPSKAFDDMEAKEGTEQIGSVDALARARSGGGFALERGRAVHRLLELLPEIDVGEREEAALRFLKRHPVPSLAAQAESLTAEVLAVLEEPSFADVFSGQARTEVSVAGRLGLNDGSAVEVSGQIDRLCVRDSEVVIVDFKTDREVPDDASAVADAYVTQLAVYRDLLLEIYPAHEVRAALLYTSQPRLVEVSIAQLEAASVALRMQTGHGSEAHSLA